MHYTTLEWTVGSLKNLFAIMSNISFGALLPIGFEQMAHRAVLPREAIPGRDPFLREDGGDPGQAQALLAERLDPRGCSLRIIGAQDSR